MKILKQAFKCSYCGKLYQIEKACLKHEKKCTRNPNIKPLCFSCANYHLSWSENEKETISFNLERYGLQVREFNPNICKAKQCKLFFDYHVIEELKDALLENGYDIMPSESKGCEFFKTIF